MTASDVRAVATQRQERGLLGRRAARSTSRSPAGSNRGPTVPGPPRQDDGGFVVEARTSSTSTWRAVRDVPRRHVARRQRGSLRRIVDEPGHAIRRTRRPSRRSARARSLAASPVRPAVQDDRGDRGSGPCEREARERAADRRARVVGQLGDPRAGLDGLGVDAGRRQVRMAAARTRSSGSSRQPSPRPPRSAGHPARQRVERRRPHAGSGSSSTARISAGPARSTVPGPAVAAISRTPARAPERVDERVADRRIAASAARPGPPSRTCSPRPARSCRRGSPHSVGGCRPRRPCRRPPPTRPARTPGRGARTPRRQQQEPRQDRPDLPRHAVVEGQDLRAALARDDVVERAPGGIRQAALGDLLGEPERAPRSRRRTTTSHRPKPPR